MGIKHGASCLERPRGAGAAFQEPSKTCARAAPKYTSARRLLPSGWDQPIYCQKSSYISDGTRSHPDRPGVHTGAISGVRFLSEKCSVATGRSILGASVVARRRSRAARAEDWRNLPLMGTTIPNDGASAAFSSDLPARLTVRRPTVLGLAPGRVENRVSDSRKASGLLLVPARDLVAI